MQLTHLRAFLVVLEEGSVSRAATRLRVGQPSLTRQIATLEQEIGASLFERHARGVAVTPAGQALAAQLPKPLLQIETALANAARVSRGERTTLSVGYLPALARPFLNPALIALRASHPHVRVKLLTMCPGTQLRALESGEIDIGLMGEEGRGLADAFYVKKLRTFDVCAVLPYDHELAGEDEIPLRALRRELFIGKREDDSPTFNAWTTQLCRRGGFRPRIQPIAESHSQLVSLILSEGGVALLPALLAEHESAGVVLRPLSDTFATWDLLVVWQRGKLAGSTRAFLDALPAAPQPSPVPAVLSA